jgi:hypothetical protein
LLLRQLPAAGLAAAMQRPLLMRQRLQALLSSRSLAVLLRLLLLLLLVAPGCKQASLAAGVTACPWIWTGCWALVALASACLAPSNPCPRSLPFPA